MRFTQEQIDQAKQVPVERIAKSVGYTVVKKGRYFSLEEILLLLDKSVSVLSVSTLAKFKYIPKRLKGRKIINRTIMITNILLFSFCILSPN